MFIFFSSKIVPHTFKSYTTIASQMVQNQEIDIWLTFNKYNHFQLCKQI